MAKKPWEEEGVTKSTWYRRRRNWRKKIAAAATASTVEKAILPSAPKRTVVIIAGGAKQSRARHLDELAESRDVEFWGFNAIRYSWVPRWDRMFNVHKFDLLKRYKWPVEREAQWAATHRNIPFYVADPWPDGWLPSQRIFPRGTLAAMGPRGDYHCNSIDWFIHFALYEKFDAIEVHGCDVALNFMEQMSARACIEYWTGVAEGRGVRVKFFDSDLFYAYHVVRSERVYGYDDCPAWEDKTRDAVPGSPPYSFGE